MKKFRFKSIAMTIFVAFAVIMIAFAGILYFVVQAAASGMNERSADGNLKRQAALVNQMLNNRYEGAWAVRDGVLFKGVYQMNDIFDFPDDLMESTGINFTLFAGDTRVTTNVLDLDGVRAVGTQVSAEVAAHVLTGGDIYIGHADVVGTPNYTYYEPILGPNEEIIGMFFIGLPADEMIRDLQRMTAIVLGAVLLAAIIASLVSYIIVRRIGNQVKLAADTAGKLAMGDAELEIPVSAQARADEIGTLMRSMQELVGSQQAMAKTALEVSKGNLDIEVASRSDKDILALSMQAMLVNLRRMADSVKQLTVEAAAGNLETRGDAQAFEGGYREIVAGVNATLDAVTEPLMEADHVLGRLAVSDATVPMSEDYNGDFKKLAVQINQVRDMFSKTESVCINVAAGDFSLYPVLLKTAETADDNNRLLPAMISMMDSVRSMSDSADELADAARRGDLDFRADASAFSGVYAEVVENLNQALEAMAAPLSEMNQVLAKVADGDLTVRMIGEYHGSYDEIKQSINRMSDSLLETMMRILQASEQVAASAGEISNASGALSQGSTEQASSIEELS
ncbi:MAG: methyl-accepting chemotaxis protein, partial [Clostridiaceae bacterium]|nr:methyl-accepting chemotaxis protein [Clostridiaceae bacterium]